MCVSIHVHVYLTVMSCSRCVVTIQSSRRWMEMQLHRASRIPCEHTFGLWQSTHDHHWLYTIGPVSTTNDVCVDAQHDVGVDADLCGKMIYLVNQRLPGKSATPIYTVLVLYCNLLSLALLVG